MIPQFAFLLWIKASIEKLMCGGLVLYALRHKQNVAAKFGDGKFELIATGDRSPMKLK
jgi:hypothetical protein